MEHFRGTLNLVKLINNDLLNEDFIAYSLSNNITKSILTTNIPQRPFERSFNETSYARTQMRFKTNHLHIDDEGNLFYVDEQRHLRLRKSKSSLLSPFETILDLPPSDINTLIQEDFSISSSSSTDSEKNTKSSILSVSDGESQLYILEITNGQSSVLYHGVPIGFTGFHVIGSNCNEDGTFDCILKYLEETKDNSTSSTNITSPSSQSSKGSTNSLQMNEKPASLSKISHIYHVVILTFKRETSENKMVLNGIQRLCGKDDVQAILFDSKNRFCILSDSPIVPILEIESKGETKNSSTVETETQSSFNMEEVNARLSKYTTETLESPNTNFRLDTRMNLIDEDEEEDFAEEVNFPSIYVYSKKDGSYDMVHSQGMNAFKLLCIGKSERNELHLGLKYGVDMVVFKVKFTGNDNQQPLSFEHVATFDAFAFVLKGKENGRFTTFTNYGNYGFAIILEYERFVFAYKRRIEGDKSTHQIIDLPSNQFLGVQVLNNNVIILSQNSITNVIL